MSSLRVSLWEQLAFHQLCCSSFLMLSRMPRTSPPLAGIRSLPINPALSNCVPSDWLGAKAKRPHPLGCSFPYCDLMSPEPAAFLQPLTPLAVYLSLLWECEIGKQRFPPHYLLALLTKAVAMYSFFLGYKVCLCLKPVKAELWSGKQRPRDKDGILSLEKH